MESSIKIDQGVDWTAPWLSTLSPLGREVASSPHWRDALNQRAARIGLLNHRRLPVQFVPQSELPDGVSYEMHISTSGCVPTRDNLHDFFNALVWLTFPRTKAQLNALQAAQIVRLGIGKSRGPARDAATLFDENAALLAVSETQNGRELVDALRAHQWNEVFLDHRPRFNQEAEVLLFGHALMEKLANPYKAITAHSLVCWVSPDFHHLALSEKCALLDENIAVQLTDRELLPGWFSPLPVLGVPDWCIGQGAEFYADTAIFRPARFG